MSTISKPIPKSSAEIRLEAAMNSYFQMNNTHRAIVKKATPGSALPDMLKQASEAHKVNVSKLMTDKTKTDTHRRLLASKSANVQIERIFKELDKEQKQAIQLRGHFELQIAKELNISGTTDILIRQNQLACLMDMKWSDVLASIRKGDTETVKALELPLAKHIFNLRNDQKRMEVLRITGEKVLLGDDYAKLQQARTADDAFTAIGAGLMDQFNENEDTGKQITATIVEEVA